MTEPNEPMCNGVRGFSTEGNEGQLLTDKGPETADSILK